jgi:hypothetical protein
MSYCRIVPFAVHITITLPDSCHVKSKLQIGQGREPVSDERRIRYLSLSTERPDL